MKRDTKNIYRTFLALMEILPPKPMQYLCEVYPEILEYDHVEVSNAVAYFADIDEAIAEYEDEAYVHEYGYVDSSFSGVIIID